MDDFLCGLGAHHFQGKGFELHAKTGMLIPAPPQNDIFSYIGRRTLEGHRIGFLRFLVLEQKNRESPIITGKNQLFDDASQFFCHVIYLV